MPESSQCLYKNTTDEILFGVEPGEVVCFQLEVAGNMSVNGDITAAFKEGGFKENRRNGSGSIGLVS